MMKNNFNQLTLRLASAYACESLFGSKVPFGIGRYSTSSEHPLFLRGIHYDCY